MTHRHRTATALTSLIVLIVNPRLLAQQGPLQLSVDAGIGTVTK